MSVKNLCKEQSGLLEAIEWKPARITRVVNLEVPVTPSAFLNASAKVAGFGLEAICGASSVPASG